MNYNLDSDNYLGETVDNCHRIVHVFTDGDRFHAVYNLGEEGQHVSTAFIKTVKDDVEGYMYTPYVEFIGSVNSV